MRISLALGAWLDHEPVWLPPGEADAVLAALRDELSWEQRDIVLFGRRILQPRLIAWAGDVGYRYSGQTLEPRPFTPAARGLLARVCERTGVPFNHVLANRYRSGDDSMGLHADDEPELGEDPVVAIVSLGTSRRLAVRPRRKGVRERHDVDLRHGRLLIMGGTCQRHYVHGVPRQPGFQSERISLTFRRLSGRHEAGRPRRPAGRPGSTAGKPLNVLLQDLSRFLHSCGLAGGGTPWTFEELPVIPVFPGGRDPRARTSQRGTADGASTEIS